MTESVQREVEEQRQQHVPARVGRVGGDCGSVVVVGALEHAVGVRVHENIDAALQCHGVEDAVEVAVSHHVQRHHERHEEVGQDLEGRRQRKEDRPQPVDEQVAPDEHDADHDDVLDGLNQQRVVAAGARPLADDARRVAELDAQEEREEPDEGENAPHRLLLHDLPQDLAADLHGRVQRVHLLFPVAEHERQRQDGDHPEHDHGRGHRNVGLRARAQRQERQHRREDGHKTPEDEVRSLDGAAVAQRLALRVLDHARVHAHDDHAPAGGGVVAERRAHAGNGEHGDGVDDAAEDHVALAA
ncbi:hypothetical protein ON010_g3276 [Phytophthora cinnamomi]|nr:hypothetical protein ON010_g3276 [Phytophthora cinnamomi]